MRLVEDLDRFVVDRHAEVRLGEERERPCVVSTVARAETALRRPATRDDGGAGVHPRALRRYRSVPLPASRRADSGRSCRVRGTGPGSRLSSRNAASGRAPGRLKMGSRRIGQGLVAVLQARNIRTRTTEKCQRMLLDLANRVTRTNLRICVGRDPAPRSRLLSTASAPSSRHAVAASSRAFGLPLNNDTRRSFACCETMSAGQPILRS
jgi:hypothetical protein